MNQDSKIFVAGHGGLVGSSITRELKRLGYTNFVERTHAQLDLTRQADVEDFFAAEQPEIVFLAAAKVGGIYFNNIAPAEFMYTNLAIQTNVIEAAYKNGVKKFVFMGSGCIYPRIVPQPIKESYLLTASLEQTNEAYAIAKIAGLKMCSFYRRQYGADFISVMPCNLYGPGDNYHPQHSHVIPGLIRKFHEAKLSGADYVTLWGTGTAMREFLYIDDLASASVFLMENYTGEECVNIGCGTDMTIGEIAAMIGEVVGFHGELRYDTSMPDGTPRKLLDSSKLFAMGWRPKVSLREGLERTYADFLENVYK